ncbi:hypothetical protein KY290_012724 [Solanum tuberosum]|uniref:Integrase core domain containing protein n=1 Tax=Solanum tuberosum TaxID=4113 RepID=A0ABQ7VJZ7_SOLTU|nr:hypothetical protein KY285_012598 [Solanum tuberosum]KAH0768743.1 hypothetical protein KY290_012724 [Solanum tuberosum]
MKGEIIVHKQLPGKVMHDIWWRFSQKLKKCQNHGLTERHLKQAFYRSLNYVTKHVVDVVCGGSFMRKPFSESMQLMDEVSKNNRAWYTRDAEVGDLGYTFELLAEQRKREEERDQDMAHMRTQIDLHTKHIVSKSEKMKRQITWETKEFSGIITRATRVTILEIQVGKGRIVDRPTNREQGNWKNRDGYRNDRSGVYAPPGNRDRASDSSSGSKLEGMLAKVLQNVESTDAGVKEMKSDFSSMRQLVDSHTTPIKQIEQQLGKL